jgi:hypothetical protein
MSQRTFDIATGADDAVIYANSATWPPPVSGTNAGEPVSIARKGFPIFAGYDVANIVLRFDTSSLPDNAQITGASLRIWVTALANGDTRNLGADYHDWSPSEDSTDFTTGSLTAALDAPISGLAVGTNTLSLSTLTLQCSHRHKPHGHNVLTVSMQWGPTNSR